MKIYRKLIDRRRITQCSIRHLYNLPATTDAEKKQKDSYIEVAKAAERRRCGHHELDAPLSTLECLESVVDPKSSGTNKHRYVVASQDVEVRAKMRSIAGVPLVYVNRSVMILEPMATKTAEVRDKEEKGKIRAGLKTRRGAQIGEKRKREEDGEDDAEDAAGMQEGVINAAVRKTKKVRGPKEPNPLSVKKAQKGKKPVAKEVEHERAVIKKATIRDPQVGEQALDALEAVNSSVGGVNGTLRKRKRKRKDREGTKADVPVFANGESDM